MRPIAFILGICILFLSNWNLAAEEDKIDKQIDIHSLYVQTSGKIQNLNDTSLFNPDNILELPAYEMLPVAVVGGSLLSVEFEIEAVGDLIKPNASSPFECNLNELYKSVPCGDYAFLTIGKKRINWDSSPFMRPLDFFDTNRQSLEINNQSSPDDGRTAIVMNFSISDFSSTLVLCDDRWTKEDPYNYRGGLQAGLRMNLLVGPMSLTGVASVIRTKKEKISPALGLAADTTIGNNFKLYFSGSARRGSFEMVSKAAIEDDAMVYMEPSVGQWRIDDAKIYPQVTAGVQWNPNSENTLYLAGLYDSNKYKDSEWKNLLSAAKYHADDSLLDIYPTELIEGNQAWDGMVSKTILSRRLHAAVRWSFTSGALETGCNYIFSLEDFSGFGKVGIVYFVTDTCSLSVNSIVFHGNDDTEFGEYPMSSLYGFLLSYALN